MLVALDELDDAAWLWTWFLSRPLSPAEQIELTRRVDAWLQDWHTAYPMCATATCRLIQRAQLLVWAIDHRGREPLGELSGSDIDPFLAVIDALCRSSSLPLTYTSGFACLIGGELVTDRDHIRRALLAGGGQPTPALVAHNCTIGRWRGGRLFHPWDQCSWNPAADARARADR
jgi:hypothetical protein